MTTTDTVATVHVGRHRIVFSTNGLRAIHVLVERTAPLLPAYGGAQAMIALLAWAKVFETATEHERTSALFAYPIASQCMSMPYSIKQALIKSVCEISHQTNRFLDSRWNERALPQRPNFSDAGRLAGRFKAWPDLSAALAPLNDDAFKVASDDYRNQFNHGFPRRIEYGYTPILRRDPLSSATGGSYQLYDLPPLRLNDLIPLLDPQYQAAIRCYDRYIDLIKEQKNVWPTT